MKSDKQTVNLVPGKYQRKKKQPVWRLASWNVRTMCRGLSYDLSQVDDSRKTAIINRELKRLNIDIAALQETRTDSIKGEPQGTRLHVLLAREGTREAKDERRRI